MDSNYDAWEPWDTESETPIEETLFFDDLSATLYDMIRSDVAPFQPLILASNNHTLAIRKDSAVIATGDNEHGQCDVSEWRDIVAIASCQERTIGLKKNGTVIASNEKLPTWETSPDGSFIIEEAPRYDISDWKDIIGIATGEEHIVGIKRGGSVIAVGSNWRNQCDINDWKNVIYVSAHSDYTLALKSDGTIIVTHDKTSDMVNLYVDVDFLPFPLFYESYLYNWKNIVAVSANNGAALGLRKNGTVAALGWEKYGQCDVRNWRNIIAVAAGYKHSVGLKADGTVVATGDNEYGQCNVSEWKDIVAVSAGTHHTVGLKRDGTVVATGDNSKGQCNTDNWKLF